MEDWKESARALAVDSRTIRTFRALPITVFLSLWAFVPGLRNAIPVECPIIYWYFAMCCTSVHPLYVREMQQQSQNHHPKTSVTFRSSVVSYHQSHTYTHVCARGTYIAQTFRSMRLERRQSRAKLYCWGLSSV